MMTDLEATLWKAHELAAERESVSTGVMKVAFVSNGADLMKSIAAGLMCLGGRHAPIKETYQLITDIISKEVTASSIVSHCGGFIPGFGSAFVKGKRDPILEDIRECLLSRTILYESMANNIRVIIKKELDKNLHPNIAYYTAAVAHYTQTDILFCESILLKARINKWIEILQKEINNETKQN